MFGDIYKNRRVLVTGHTGFKGSWLTAWLLHLGAKVAGFSQKIPTDPSLYALLEFGDSIKDIRGDVRKSSELTAVLKDFQPEIIFHLAAQPLVRASYLNPAETIETNAIGTLNLLEAVRQTPSVQAVVCITSDKAYRNDEQIWGYREKDHLGGTDPYSASKGCAEIIAHSYFASYFSESGPRCATTRAGNVIGGGDWAEDRIVPDCVRAWIKNQSVEIRSPKATRPWQHVLEPLSGYLLLGARLFVADGAEHKADRGHFAGFPLAGEAFNFGPSANSIHTVEELVLALKGYWQGFDAKLNSKATCGLQECTLLKLCCDKALGYLQWKATLDFDLTMSFTAAWYLQYRQMPDNIRDFTLRQIDAYCWLAQRAGQIWSADEIYY